MSILPANFTSWLYIIKYLTLWPETSWKVYSLEKAVAAWYLKQEAVYENCLYGNRIYVYRLPQRLLIPLIFFFKSQFTIILFLWSSKVMSTPSCPPWTRAYKCGISQVMTERAATQALTWKCNCTQLHPFYYVWSEALNTVGAKKNGTF